MPSLLESPVPESPRVRGSVIGWKIPVTMKNSAAAKTGHAERAPVVSITKARGDSLGPSVKERMAAGKALRDRVPRPSHGKWAPAADRPDPEKAAARGRAAP